MGNDNILIVVVLAVVAYLILTAEKAGAGMFGASLFGATAETSAGTITSTGAAGAVREISKGACLGYIFNPALFAACIAANTVTQSPQTPAPTPLYPQYPTSEGSISSSELCNPSSPYYVGDAVANAPGGCYG